jgi:WD40 repeat protein
MDKAILVWDAAAGKRSRSVKQGGPVNAVPVLAAPPGGKRVVAWDPDITVTQTSPPATRTVTRIETYDVTDGKQVSSLEFSNPDSTVKVNSLSLSADGGVAAAGGSDGVVRLWDVAAEKPLGGELRVTAGPVADLCLTPDKKTLVTADSQGWLKIWDLTRREPRKVKSGPGGEGADAVEAHKLGLACFAMAPDGARFATAGKDSVVKLWETSTGRLLREWDLKQPPLPDPTKWFVQSLAFTPDGKQLATANANTTAYLLDCP